MGKRDQIVETLLTKGAVKQVVFDKTFDTFLLLKDVLQEYAVEINDTIEGSDKRIKMIYQDRGKFEAQLQIGGDLLIFSMHTNVFSFERSNPIWKSSYVEKEPLNVYCGVINIYNFLSDSLKYNRLEDQGYLVARIFINRQLQYIVEGKRQISARHESFGNATIDQLSLIEIVENCISYTVSEFDLLTPPYDIVKIATVEQVNTKIEYSKLQTGKRLGYQFRSDDV